MAALPPATGNGTKRSKLGHGLAKVLRIDVPEKPQSSSADQSIITIIDDTYIEEDPTVLEWIKNKQPTGKGSVNFFISLFPFISWIGKYNRTWFYGDMVAGITVGAVVVPQGSMCLFRY